MTLSLPFMQRGTPPFRFDMKAQPSTQAFTINQLCLLFVVPCAQRQCVSRALLAQLREHLTQRSTRTLAQVGGAARRLLVRHLQPLVQLGAGASPRVRIQRAGVGGRLAEESTGGTKGVNAA